MIEKSLAKNIRLPSNRKKKNFQKPPKIHKDDKKEYEEEQREKAFTIEDKSLTQEEKEYCKYIENVLEENVQDFKEELLKTREARSEIPKELRKFRGNGRGGFFQCIYCFQNHDGWYTHRRHCKKYMGKTCDACGQDFFCSNEEHLEKCKAHSVKFFEDEITRALQNSNSNEKPRKKRKIKCLNTSSSDQ